jgi:hypothetical protein
MLTIIIGSIDSDDRPWASIVVGKPGFATSPLPSLLQINTNIIPGMLINFEIFKLLLTTIRRSAKAGN